MISTAAPRSSNPPHVEFLFYYFQSLTSHRNHKVNELDKLLVQLYIAAQGKTLIGLGSRSGVGQKKEKPNKILIKQDRFTQNWTVRPVQRLDRRVGRFDDDAIPARSITLNQIKKKLPADQV